MDVNSHQSPSTRENLETCSCFPEYLFCSPESPFFFTHEIASIHIIASFLRQYTGRFPLHICIPILWLTPGQLGGPELEGFSRVRTSDWLVGQLSKRKSKPFPFPVVTIWFKKCVLGFFFFFYKFKIGSNIYHFPRILGKMLN